MSDVAHMGEATRRPAPSRSAGRREGHLDQLRAYEVQPCHHFGPPGAAPPTYAVPVTTVPAFVAIAPVKVARPAVAIGELAAGVKSKSLMLAGVAPTAGMPVKSEAAVAALSVRLFAGRSSSKIVVCVAGGGLEEARDVRREDVAHLKVRRRRRGRRRAGTRVGPGVTD